MRRLFLVSLSAVFAVVSFSSFGQEYLPNVLEVKFRDGQDIRLRDGAPKDVGSPKALKSGKPVEVLSGLPVSGLSWSRSITGVDESTLEGFRGADRRRGNGKPLPDLNLYFRVELPEGSDAEAVAEALRAQDDVEAVYRIPEAVIPPLSTDWSVSNNASGVWQRYLDAAPNGVDARYAWEQGYSAAGIKISDVEYNYNANHLDLPTVTLVSGTALSADWADHGTAVLGEMFGLDNGWGVKGIAYGGTAYIAGPYRTTGGYSLANSIISSLSVLSTGDVILIEQQTTGPNGGTKYVPVEWYKPTYDAIVVAVANGVSVVEAAGNGGENLDAPEFSTGNGGHYPFLPANDSGAIIVGAGRPPNYSDPRSRASFSTYGSTLDLQGYGYSVVTTGYGSLYNAEGENLEYTATFNGTSSASPIVAGSVAVIQQAHMALLGRYASPDEVKELLRTTGTPQEGTGNIGPLPDLRAAIEALKAQAVNVTFAPNEAVDCQAVTVTFQAGASVLTTAETVNVFYHFSTNSTDWMTREMTRLDAETFSVTFEPGIDIPNNAPLLEIAFNDGNGNWENNGGDNWMTTLMDCDAPVNGVRVIPYSPIAGEPVTIEYDPAGRPLAAAGTVYLHHTYNDNNWTELPGIAMIQSGAYWTVTYTVGFAASNITFAFNDGSLWDNNNGSNWTADVTGGDSTLTGFVIVDPDSDITVSNDVNSYRVRGVADDAEGMISWTNEGTGRSGMFPASDPWAADVPLDPGTNLLVFCATNFVPGGLSTNAEDSADAYSGWGDGSNEGAGFGAWDVNAYGQSGAFISGPANSNCNIGVPTFGLWSHASTNYVEAVRPMSAPLAIGQTFHVTMENGWIWESGGSVGVALRDEVGVQQWFCAFTGGDSFYETPLGFTSIGWTDQGVDIAFTLTSSNSYSVNISARAGGSQTLTGTVASSIAEFRAWSFSNGTDDGNNDQRDFFFDDLRITENLVPGVVTNKAMLSITREAPDDAEPLIDNSHMVFNPEGQSISMRISDVYPGRTYYIFACDDLMADPHIWTIMSNSAVTAGGEPVMLMMTNFPAGSGSYRAGYLLP